MTTKLTFRGLLAEHASVAGEGDIVSLELVSSQGMTVEFQMTPAAANGLATDLVQVAETLRNASDAAERIGDLGMVTMHAPLTKIVDFGELPGRGEVFVALETEEGATLRYRLSATDALTFARAVLAHLPSSGKK